MAEFSLLHATQDLALGRQVERLLAQAALRVRPVELPLDVTAGNRPLDYWMDVARGPWCLFLASRSACLRDDVAADLVEAAQSGLRVITATWEFRAAQLPAWCDPSQTVDLQEGSVFDVNRRLLRFARERGRMPEEALGIAGALLLATTGVTRA
jgi:hypothetical protein